VGLLGGGELLGGGVAFAEVVFGGPSSKVGRPNSPSELWMLLSLALCTLLSQELRTKERLDEALELPTAVDILLLAGAWLIPTGWGRDLRVPMDVACRDCLVQLLLIRDQHEGVTSHQRLHMR
jgi:hypothetical protein